MTSRYKIIAIQTPEAEFAYYIIKDMITKDRISPWFEAPEDAEYWLAITGLQ